MRSAPPARFLLGGPFFSNTLPNFLVKFLFDLPVPFGESQSFLSRFFFFSGVFRVLVFFSCPLLVAPLLFLFAPPVPPVPPPPVDSTFFDSVLICSSPFFPWFRLSLLVSPLFNPRDPRPVLFDPLPPLPFFFRPPHALLTMLAQAFPCLPVNFFLFLHFGRGPQPISDCLYLVPVLLQAGFSPPPNPVSLTPVFIDLITFSRPHPPL